MTDITTLYNSLPSLREADKQFVNRDQILSQLAPLLVEHGNKFGVCLVHRHCKLDSGEVMVATGNVCQPERNVQCNPDRWLATGEPFEFTREATRPPPQKLLKDFRKIVGDIKVLGLFYIQEGDDGITLERTEGRRNISEKISHDDSTRRPRDAENTTAAGWRTGANGMPTSCYQCASCIGSGPSHAECQDSKLEQLERRPGLGHKIEY
jgi:hypothetical protein